MPYIYKTTNTNNNRIYVGKSSKIDFDPNYFGSGVLVKQSINKNSGCEHLNVEVIEWCSEDELDEREIYWINKLSQSENLYNIASGGSGGNTMKYKTEEEKKRIYEKVLETKIRNGNLKDTPTTRAKKSKASRTRIRQKPWTLPDNRGRTHSGQAYENIVKARESRIGQVMITDGQIEMFIDAFEEIPTGFRRGRSDSFIDLMKSQVQTDETKAKRSKTMIGRKSYTSGVKNMWVYGDIKPPVGWVKGMTKKSTKGTKNG